MGYDRNWDGRESIWGMIEIVRCGENVDSMMEGVGGK